MPRTPWTALTLPYSFFSLLWLSHSRDRGPPSPPLVAVVATTVVPPHQSDQRLRLDAPDLSMELRNAGSPASPPTPSSPSSAARISGDPVLPPTLPRPRLHLEWIRCEPLLLLLCSPPPFSPLAPSPTAAESFSPPAMAWPWPQPPQLVLEPTVVLTTVPGAHSTHQRLPWRPASPNPSLP